MTEQLAFDLAAIWLEHSEFHRLAASKNRCAVLSWYYLMQATMKELHA